MGGEEDWQQISAQGESFYTHIHAHTQEKED